jgi:hypothetical protein
MFRSYDHLQAEIYLIGFTRLTTDQLFLECSDHYGSLVGCFVDVVAVVY